MFSFHKLNCVMDPDVWHTRASWWTPRSYAIERSMCIFTSICLVIDTTSFAYKQLLSDYPLHVKSNEWPKLENCPHNRAFLCCDFCLTLLQRVENSFFFLTEQRWRAKNNRYSFNVRYSGLCKYGTECMKPAYSAITLPISIVWKNEKNYVNEKYGWETDNTCKQTANTHTWGDRNQLKKGNQEQKINKITDVYILSANEQARNAERWKNAHWKHDLVSSARQRNNIQSWPGSGFQAISNRTQMHTITLIKRQMREMPKL